MILIQYLNCFLCGTLPFPLVSYCNNYVIIHFKKFCRLFYIHLGFPGGSKCKESASNLGDLGAIPVRPRVNPWVRNIHWRREWQPTPIFLLGESRWTEKPDGLQSRGSQRIRQGWATNTFTLPSFPLFYFILLLGIGKHPANQCANYNLTDLRPEHRDTLGGTWRTLAADSSSVCHSSQRQNDRSNTTCFLGGVQNQLPSRILASHVSLTCYYCRWLGS